MYVSSNEIHGGRAAALRRAVPLRRVQARPGWFPRLLAEALLLAWALATEFFDGESVARRRIRGRNRRRMMERRGYL
ncbi:MAG: hypothetical protein LBV70_06690 [Candidatus Adiutrix sp.]|nr:hypothetical protein [Candidatus Adiutrix sp.]